MRPSMYGDSPTPWTEGSPLDSAIASLSTFEDKKELEQFNSKPFHYENQFDIAAGHYNLKVAFNPQGADSFGKLEMPLVIDPYDGKQFSLSAVALSKDVHPVSRWGRAWMLPCWKTARRW